MGHNEIPCIIEPDETSPARRTAWARLIQKIYEVDPLTCPKCKGAMKIISFIDQPEVIKAILQHIGLWKKESRPPPKTKPPPSGYYADEQIPSYDMTMTTRITLLKPICKKIRHWLNRRGVFKTSRCGSHNTPYEIGRLVGRVDYSAVSQARKRLQEKMAGDKYLKQKYDEIVEQLTTLSS